MPPPVILAMILGAALPLAAVVAIGVLSLRRALRGSARQPEKSVGSDGASAPDAAMSVASTAGSGASGSCGADGGGSC